MLPFITDFWPVKIPVQRGQMVLTTEFLQLPFRIPKEAWSHRGHMKSQVFLQCLFTCVRALGSLFSSLVGFTAISTRKDNALQAGHVPEELAVIPECNSIIIPNKAWHVPLQHIQKEFLHCFEDSWVTSAQCRQAVALEYQLLRRTKTS